MRQSSAEQSELGDYIVNLLGRDDCIRVELNILVGHVEDRKVQVTHVLRVAKKGIRGNNHRHNSNIEQVQTEIQRHSQHDLMLRQISSRSYRTLSIHHSNGLASPCAGTMGDLESDSSASLSLCCSSDDSFSLFEKRLPVGFTPLVGWL